MDSISCASEHRDLTAQETFPRHFLRLRKPQHFQQGRRHIRQDPIAYPPLPRILGNIDRMDEICRMGRMWRTIRIPHELTITMIGGNQ